MNRQARIAMVALATIAVTGGVALAVVGRPRAAAQHQDVTTATATVTRGTVSERAQLPGVLGFDGSYPVTHQGRPGIVTWVAEPASVVERGRALYAVANRPVFLLLGTVPAYRDLASGMTDGPDVRQLEENLAALGLDPGRVDQRFTAATAAAVRRWQAASGVPAAERSGALPLGTVVFAPVALRVSAVAATVGAPAEPGGAVLSATSTARVVTAQLTTDRQQQVHVGDQVLVSFSGAAPVPGAVVRIGRVAVAASRSGPGPGGDGGSAPPQVTVTVRLTAPVASDLDQAPVTIAITTQTRTGVLLVPVVALLARPGGGYQVRLDSGRLVEVTPGLFDSNAGTVEVTGDLTAGLLVQVPAP